MYSCASTCISVYNMSVAIITSGKNITSHVTLEVVILGGNIFIILRENTVRP